jgi:methionine synthase II (cobalamin-independent)
MGQMSLHPPFRAEHIGSLVRPPELLRALARHAAGELDAIRGAIGLQEGVGLEVITDGNLSRRAADHRSGAADTQSLEPQISDLRDEADAVRGWRQETILRLFRRRYLRSRCSTLAEATPKVTLPGPCYIHYRACKRYLTTGSLNPGS